MGKEQQISRDRLQKLIETIKNANWENCDAGYMAGYAEKLINELQQCGVNCVDRFVKKLLDRIGDKEDYLDILMEGRLAVILARNHLSDIEIEYCGKGPDLKARWNRKTVYFEVTRKRPGEDDKSEDVCIERAKIEDIIAMIQWKLPQLEPGELSVVVLWGDRRAWSEHELREAHKYILQEICDDPNKYKGLSAILFTDGGYEGATLRQFFLFENDKASKPLGPRLTKKLESLHERDLKQLQRENEELGAALERILVKGN